MGALPGNIHMEIDAHAQGRMGERSEGLAGLVRISRIGMGLEIEGERKT